MARPDVELIAHLFRRAGFGATRDELEEHAAKGYEATVEELPLNGRVQCIDHCVAHLVAALNAANIRTVASCCGHQQMAGRIDLEDGRVLAIIEDLEELAPGQPVWHAPEQWAQPLILS